MNNVNALPAPKRLRVTVALAAVAAVLATLLPTGSGAVATEQVIVRATRSTAAAVAAVVEAGGEVIADLAALDVVVGRIPAGSADELESSPAVVEVTPDRAYRVQRKPGAELGEPSRTAAATIGATSAWTAGADGEHVGVAIVDTGIANAPGVRERVVAGVDVSGDSRKMHDGYGHGTFMSGLVTSDTGIAPGSHLVSVKVAADDGSTSLAAVLMGLAAALDARDAFDVRVVLLAIGREHDEESEVLELALRQLWASGLVVVVPSGNDGVVLSPGRDPYLLTAGALDDNGTADPADDVVPEWSAAEGGKPDLLAPGVSVVSARAPGSQIDKENKQGRVGGHEFRGSGTSMAAAVTAGAAAVLIGEHPELTPDQVKGRLVASARQAPTGEAGVLDLVAALASDAGPANGDLEPVEVLPREHDGTTHPAWQGSTWQGSTWQGSTWQGSNWAGSNWAGSNWAGSNWAGSNWAGSNWAGSNWAGSNWAGSNWAGSNWAGSNWAGSNWAGSNWAGSNWAGSNWAGSNWAGSNWAGSNWE